MVALSLASGVAGQRAGWGVFNWAAGGEYSGRWMENRPHGEGVFRWADGSSYRGLWEGGQRSGEGVFTEADGLRVYKGEWSADHRHGKGEEKMIDGGTYSGRSPRCCNNHFYYFISALILGGRTVCEMARENTSFLSQSWAHAAAIEVGGSQVRLSERGSSGSKMGIR